MGLDKVTTLTKNIKKLEKQSEKIDTKIKKMRRATVKPILKMMLSAAPPGKSYDAETYRENIKAMLKNPGNFHFYGREFDRFEELLDGWNLTLDKEHNDDGDEYDYASVSHYYIREWGKG